VSLDSPMERYRTRAVRSCGLIVPVHDGSSAIDILSKCADASWFEKLRICGQVESIYEDFAAAGKDESDGVSFGFGFGFVATRS
jgi:hypothetical protein